MFSRQHKTIAHPPILLRSSVPNHALRSHGEKSIRTSHRYEFRVLQHCTKAPLPDQSFPSPLKGKGKLWPGRGATVHQMNHSLENPTFRTYGSPVCFFLRGFCPPQAGVRKTKNNKTEDYVTNHAEMKSESLALIDNEL